MKNKSKILHEIAYLEGILKLTFGTGLTERGIKRLSELKAKIKQ
jgi:hypothetical protein